MDISYLQLKNWKIMRKNEYNLDLIEPLVRTQYGDYGGYIQIDGHSGSELFQLCEDHGIDMKKYFLIGLSCGEHTTEGIGKRNKIHCSALLLERKKYGETFDEIQENLEVNNGKANAQKISFEVKYSDFGKYIKRIDFMVVTKLTKYISELKIKETY